MTINRSDILIQQDGRVWFKESRTLLGRLARLANSPILWNATCEDCGYVSRAFPSKSKAALLLAEHWKEAELKATLLLASIGRRPKSG